MIGVPWFRRSDAAILTGVLVVSFVIFAGLGWPRAATVSGLAVGALVYVGYCWYDTDSLETESRPEAQA